jgi:hypothetical protein
MKDKLITIIYAFFVQNILSKLTGLRASAKPESQDKEICLSDFQTFVHYLESEQKDQRSSKNLDLYRAYLNEDSCKIARKTQRKEDLETCLADF